MEKVDINTRTGSQADRAKAFFKKVVEIETEPDEPPKKRRALKINYKCNLCNSTISGNTINSYIFTSHIKNKHLEHYNLYVNNAVLNKKDERQRKLAEEKFLQMCVEIVAINGRPFESLLDSGIKKMAEKHIADLKNLGSSLDLGDKNHSRIKQCMASVSLKIKQSIASEIRGLPVAIMVDIGTKNYRSVLGTSIQYFVHGKTKVDYIGMSLLRARHTAENITNSLVECLKASGVKHEQIASFTSDNASNMRAMIRKFQAYHEHDDADIDFDDAGTSVSNDIQHDDDLDLDSVEDLNDAEIEEVNKTKI